MRLRKGTDTEATFNQGVKTIDSTTWSSIRTESGHFPDNRRSTGIPKILEAMANNGFEAPSFETDPDRTSLLVRLPVRPAPEEDVTPQVTPQVNALLAAIDDENSREELQAKLKLADRQNFKKLYLIPALEAGLIEGTIPDKPNSRLQKYRLTAKGRNQVKKS